MFNVLLVEDSSSLTQIMDISLKQAGFNIQEVRTGRDAIHAAEGNSFDVVLCDTDMVDGDAIKLIKKLCQLTGKKHSSLIAFSNQSNGDKKESALNAGADLWIAKPFDADGLVNEVLAVMH